MKNLILILTVLIFEKVNCQPISFCGAFPPHTANSQNLDSIYFDRFGNTYDIEDSTSAIYSYSSAPGYFSVLSDLPNAYRGVVDSVLADFSNIVQRRTNYTECGDPISKNLVNLKIISAPDSPFLMAASPVWANFYYSCATGSFPMTTSNPYQILNYGRPSIFTGTDAILYVNTNVVWNLNFTNGPNSNEYDLRSVLLHELLHIFGFATLIKSNGLGTPMIGYDIYDHYLYYDKGNGPEKVILGDCMENCWSLNPDITDFYKLVVDNCVGNNTTTLGISSPLITPLNGINSYTNQDPFNNYVAHLHPHCQNSNPDFIMQPTISAGERKIDITPEEIDIICMLGYNISTCDGCFIGVGSEPFGVEFTKCCTKIFSSCLNSADTISFDDLLCNDEEGATKTITDFYSQYNSNEISFNADYISKTITITPKVPGAFRIYYTVTSCDCKQSNSYFDIYGYTCLNCSSVNPCTNLICTNGFEEFKDGQSFESLLSLGGNIYFTILKPTSNSPDICNYQNNKYLHLANVSTNPDPFIEGISLKLQAPIRQNNDVSVSFKAAAHTRRTRVKILGSYFPPCSVLDYPIDTSCVAHPCPYDPVCLGEINVDNTNVFGKVICPSSLTFKDYNLTVRNVFNKNINYIVVIPSNKIDNKEYNVYLDNVVIQEVNTCEIIDTIKHACNQFEFEAQDCNGNIDVQWNFGDPNSGSSNNVSLDNPATHTFSHDDLYTVTLSVTDSCGHISTKTMTVGVACDTFEYCNCSLPFLSSCEVKLQNTLLSSVFPNISETSLEDCCILIKGKVIIDKDFRFGHSNLKMEPGAEIEVKAGIHFTIDDHSNLFGCYEMWKGITCLNGSNLTLSESKVWDAEYGIHAYGGSTVNLQNNEFFRSYVGVFIENGAVNNSAPMNNNKFYTNGNFLPPYTGQVNIPGAYGYCGVLVKNGVFSIGSSSAVNYFYDLYNGVIGENSDVTVTKADISDLVTIRSRLDSRPKWSYPDGDGIFTNNSILTATANTISVTNGAITDYFGKSLMAYDNIISYTPSGIYCAYPKVESYIDKNQITDYYLYGIVVSSPQSSIKLMITRDTLASATYNLQSGSTAIYLENVIANGLAQVQANGMTLDPSSYGIVLKSCQKIGLQENSGSYSGITERNGIELSTSPFNIVYKNSIVDYQPISSQGNAFYFMDSKSNRVCCNNSSGTRSGFHFSNASLMRNFFRTNLILDHEYGLHCDFGAQIDDQFNCGNEWHGYYSQDASAHFGSNFDIQKSKHFVYNCNYPIWPPSIFPSQTCNFANFSNLDWFQRRGDVSDPVCISDQSCVKPFNNIIRVIRGKGGDGGMGGFTEDDGSFNANDTLIATEGFIGDNSFETRALWEMSYDLLYRLKASPSIYEENSIMSDFVSDNQSTNLGKFVRVDFSLDTLITISESNEIQLQSQLYNIDSARTKIQIIDSILYNQLVTGDDSISLINDRMNWSNFISESKLQLDTILLNFETIKANRLAGITYFLSNITPTNIIESNRKEVLIIYLNSSLKCRDTLTTTQFDDISSIGNSCSRSGGRSVILARQLYLLNEYQEFNDDTICQYEPQPIVLGSETYKLPDEKLKVYPNPSNGNFIIEVRNGNFTSGSKLFIYDLNGREVYFKSIEKECIKVEINKNDLGLLEGVFLCKVISNSNVLYSPKIILNK